MHEYYREYLEHNNLRFLIIAFNEQDEHVLKVFLHRMLVHQFPFNARVDHTNVVYEQPAKSFEKFVERGRKWVRENY
ncbi:MAG TPA: hypothetical protein VGM41_15390 [Chitinophagaceae bacterium]|jgi:hypothetical protein